MFSRLELRPAGLIKAPKDVQHELSAQMLQEFDALTVEDRSGLSKLTSFIQKHRDALDRVASGKAVIEDFACLFKDTVEGWDLPSDMIFIERVFSHVTAIGKNAAHSGMHNASCKTLRKVMHVNPNPNNPNPNPNPNPNRNPNSKVNKTPVTAADIKEHKSTWKAMHKPGSRYMQLYAKRRGIKVQSWIKKYRKCNITRRSQIDIKQKSSFDIKVFTQTKELVAALKKKNDKKEGGNLHRDSDKKYVPHAEQENAMAKVSPDSATPTFPTAHMPPPTVPTTCMPAPTLPTARTPAPTVPTSCMLACTVPTHNSDVMEGFGQ